MPRTGIRRVRREARAASAQERADAEGAELSRWRAELKAYFVESNVPAIRLASECLDPERALAGFIGRARAGTLRAYVRCWGQLRRWLLTARGSPWPTTSSDIIDYLHVRLDEPCGASVPQSLLQAIVWVEKVAGLEDQDRVSLRPEVGRAFAAASSELGLTAPPTRRAPRFPVAILAAFEKYLMDGTNPDYLRGLAWIRLVKVWATLRYDDHTWLRPSALSLTDGSLAAVLTRTKTSGAARKVRELPMIVSASCYFHDQGWLRVGFDLWKKMADYPRDYLLPRGSSDSNGVVRRMATYADASAAGHLLLRSLRAEGGQAPLLPWKVAEFWSEHSERATVPSGLAALGVSKQRRDLLGRWSPEGSDVYTRTYRAAVTRLQAKFAAQSRTLEAYSAFDESDIISELKVWLVNVRGETESEAHTLADRVHAVCDRRPSVPGGVPHAPGDSGEEKEEEDDEDGIFEEHAEVTKPPLALDQGGHMPYLIVYGPRRRLARLHRVDGCWTGRTRDLADAEFKREADPSLYSSRCRLCWPGQPKATSATDEALLSEESDSSGSSASETPVIDQAGLGDPS